MLIPGLMIDLDRFVEIKRHHDKKHRLDADVVGVVTRVDELDPLDVASPPYDDSDKQENISRAVTILRKGLSDRLGKEIAVIPISGYTRFKREKIRADRRWNIDMLTAHLVEHIPTSARIAFAKLAQLRGAQERIAREIVHASAELAAAVAWTPIPFADLPVITGVQATTITGVARVARGKANKRAVTEFLASSGINLGAAFGFREVARALIKFLPGPGELISAAVAFAATEAQGDAAIRYFLPPPADRAA